ncbi:unnamed protein product [Parnassius mnemosyne]|uniref:YqaJ viral recombinase domain-containing protein n=1 Tax=Parnassius mnemosyne TaxID=213953 RepID=A0AAV1L430_9NEOP
MCKEKYILNVSGDLDINTAAVAGAVSVGIGYSQLEELLSAIDLPMMTEPLYQKQHEFVSNAWEKALDQSMQEAAEEEKKIALEKGRVTTDGIPIIDVIVDGCWSKRSYKKNYSALSGAAAIIGKETKKILFLGVKNKYCSICAQDCNKNQTPRAHQCYENFTGASTAMESTLIVEGFRSSVEMYGLIYGRLISDGDSSTYSKILEARPYPQFTVEKVECRNHLLRNLCNKLENLITDTKYPIHLRKLITKKRIMTIRSTIRKCIKKYHDSTETIDFCTHKLFEDIQTVHLHAFGNHTNCKNYFCNCRQTETESVLADFFTSSLWQRICFIINSIAGHSRSLVHDIDSNIVECFHSVVAKLVGGKRVNYSLRRGYQTRCSASAITFNTKRKPTTILYKTIVGKSPKGRMSTLDNKYRKLRGLKKRANYKKPQKTCDAITQNKDYGEQSSKPDVSDDILNLMKETFISTLKKSEEERTRIERQTILQSESSEWLELRRSLLTASNFGKVIKMRPDTSCANIVKQLLYKININAAPMQHGREYEKKALQQLSTQEALDIRPCGLYIDPEIPYLGATPDGIIDEETIVEVKCPITAFKTGLEEAITKKKVNFWIKDKLGNLKINKNHNWFYQVQGQLHVTRKAKCVFAVWFSESQPLKTEVIYRDDDCFENKMKSKLCNFYLNCILPEILDPRHTRNMEIRNPIYIIEAIKKKEKKQKLEISKRKIQRIIPIAEQANTTLSSLYQESTRSSTPVIPEADQPTCSRYLDYNEF